MKYDFSYIKKEIAASPASVLRSKYVNPGMIPYTEFSGWSGDGGRKLPPRDRNGVEIDDVEAFQKAHGEYCDALRKTIINAADSGATDDELRSAILSFEMPASPEDGAKES